MQWKEPAANTLYISAQTGDITVCNCLYLFHKQMSRQQKMKTVSAVVYCDKARERRD